MVVSPMDMMWEAGCSSEVYLSTGGVCQQCGGVATLSKTDNRCDILEHGVIPTDVISKTDRPYALIPCGRQTHLSKKSRSCRVN